MKHCSRLITIIRKSCLTGKAIWIYRGPTKLAANKAYERACRKEINRMRRWGQTVARRKQNIMRLLGQLTDRLPVMCDMQPEQRSAAAQLLRISEEGLEYHSELYDHIMESRRRRAADRKIRQQMRERENLANRDYDK